jgi:hypothetical protein
MTDSDLLARRLTTSETTVRELRALANPAALSTDIREQRFVEHTLQVAIQANRSGRLMADSFAPGGTTCCVDSRRC